MFGTLPIIQAMKHSPISNYGGIPGVTSWLIGAPSPHGLVRLMECSREHQELIVPHSHRFDFQCLVLRGRVRNLIWQRHSHGDLFQQSTVRYLGEPGQYETTVDDFAPWSITTHEYMAGTQYSMGAAEVHSIFFGRDTAVLFFEGPEVSKTSIILEPVVDGVVVPTFQVQPWAFKKAVQP